MNSNTVNPFQRFAAMSSGVAVADECKAIFEEIKKSKKYRYCIFHIKDEKVISVEEKGDRDASYDAFLNDLQKGGDGECRYGLYDFEYEHQCQVFTECHHRNVTKRASINLMTCC